MKWVILIILIAVPQGFSQSLTIPTTLTLTPNSQIDLTAVHDCDDIRWISPENPGLIMFEYGRHGGKASDVTLVGLTSGTYKLRAIGAKAGKLSAIQTTVVTVVGPPPTPVPDPTPVPVPVPVPPTAKTLSIVTIDDTTARTVQSAAFFGDDSYWKSLTSDGTKCWKLDRSDPITARYSSYLSTGLPVIIVMDQATTKVLFSGPLPVSTSALTTLLNSLRTH